MRASRLFLQLFSQTRVFSLRIDLQNNVQVSVVDQFTRVKTQLVICIIFARLRWKDTTAGGGSSAELFGNVKVLSGLREKILDLLHCGGVVLREVRAFLLNHR